MARRLHRHLRDRLPECTLRRLQRLQHGEDPRADRPITRGRTHGVSPGVVDNFDAHATRGEVAAAVAEAFDSARVPYMVLPGPRGSVHQFAVSAGDRAAALAALDSALSAPGWVLTPRGSARRSASVLRVFRVLAAPTGQVLCGPDTACAIAFWTRLEADGVPRADGATHLPGTHLAPITNGIVRYLTEPMWHSAISAPSHWPVERSRPDLFEVPEPVDIVYTWVDGADPSWRSRKSLHSPDPAAALDRSATSLARYLNRDELRYSMRSVAMYAGWVHRIFIVTDGQIPDWLDATHPKVIVVDHRDIFADPSVLPVFNSHAIESQLHHIDGLSERYLYLNDDVFLGRPVLPELFFHANRVAKFLLAPDTTIDLSPSSARDVPAVAAAKNMRAVIEAEFGVTLRRKIQHGVHPQQRSVVEEMESRFPQMFDQVARSRFRHPDDLSIPSSLQHFYAFAQGRSVPGEWGYRYQDISRPDTARRLDGILRERPQSFCLNDMDSSEDHLDGQHAALTQFFGEYFPLPAPWERRPATPS